MKKPYVIEISTFKCKSNVDMDMYWAVDAEVEASDTKIQPGFISKESGFDKMCIEVIVVVRWEIQGDADISMAKFMKDENVKAFVNMIDGPSMKMSSYDVR